ncbi:MAG TPA: [FeFe] hydrogenase H-cluster radical SAM maturase HydE [candidate division Zixibacteria bacterium]|nr:[FeFe] hydrogenase H-cluster radical SAM maturase HydE [candidate division Zixibacteria bacterium]
MLKFAHKELVNWLRATDEVELRRLFSMADDVRRRHVGEAVHLRGLIEISSHCCRNCSYCGLRALRHITRYRMTREKILSCARKAVRLGFGTVVLQSGEDFALEAGWVADIVRTIKRETDLAVTLSLGERMSDELRLWRDAGADRYLLRFETSDADLYAKIHPSLPGRTSDRIAILRQLRDFGYEIGSGVMVGIPGQSYEILARDIETFRELDLDMIGIGPFLAHPDTPLGAPGVQNAGAEQVPNTEQMVLKTVALTRIMCPEANIPSTTALATVNPMRGRENGFQSGANVVMPNLTPSPYRQMYEIYPGKTCVDEEVEQCARCVRARITCVGREVGVGQGGRQHFEAMA